MNNLKAKISDLCGTGEVGPFDTLKDEILAIIEASTSDEQNLTR